MATQAQIDANRRNAQKSTGPVSAAGKAVSCMNALKSGVYAESAIIPGETAESLKELAARYQHDLDPQNGPEQTLVDALIAEAWLLRRFLPVEAHLWERQFTGNTRLDPKTYLGDAYINSSKTFGRHQSKHDALCRGFRTNLRELERIQEARRQAEPPVEVQPEPEPAPAPQPAAPQPVSPEIGFVPSNEPEPVADPQRPAAASHRLAHKLVQARRRILVGASGLTWKRRKPRKSA